MVLGLICSVVLVLVAPTIGVKKSIPIPYITPRDPNDTGIRGIVIFDGSGNNNNLPFTEVTGGDGYVCKSPNCYNGNRFNEMEKELEAMQSQMTSPQEFLHANVCLAYTT